jgi:peptidoglycan/xylan/chitin deacetylase (PgdA/CDA1 family)
MRVPFRRLARQARDAFEVPRDLLLGRYPPFVTGGPLPPGDVPVFVFHSLEPDSLGRKLRHLADNGYVTLSGTEYHDILCGKKAAPDKAVLLTFDDGRGSLWTVGAPLLRQYGMKGVVFLVPGRIPPRGGLGPTDDDVRAGRASAEVVRARERNGGAFLSWPEIEALAAAGTFEFESHSLTHARIHVAPELAGFVTPGLRRGYAAFDLPLIDAEGRDLLGPKVPLGTPLFRSDSRLSESARFYEDPEVRRACVEAVAGEGGEQFFLRPGWEARLRRRLGGHAVTGRLEEPREYEAAVRRELDESKREIERRTGRPVVQFCYPWHVFGSTARRLVGEVGYRIAFCGKVRGVPITRPGGDLLRIARVGEDYVERLPGRGREDLSLILRRKWTRRREGA